jgi:hypothetical protein
VYDAVADLSPAANVRETLRRPALSNRTVPTRAADFCEGTFPGWTLTPDGGAIGAMPARSAAPPTFWACRSEISSRSAKHRQRPEVTSSDIGGMPPP